MDEEEETEVFIDVGREETNSVVPPIDTPVRQAEENVGSLRVFHGVVMGCLVVMGGGNLALSIYLMVKLKQRTPVVVTPLPTFRTDESSSHSPEDRTTSLSH